MSPEFNTNYLFCITGFAGSFGKLNFVVNDDYTKRSKLYSLETKANILYSKSNRANDVLFHRTAISHSCKKHKAIIEFCNVFGDQYDKFNFDNTQ